MRQIILPCGFEVYDGGVLVAVAVRNIYAGEPWGAEMFVNYAGAPAELPFAVIKLHEFAVGTALPSGTLGEAICAA